MYPTAGMQTNGEMIDVNFGQKPFKFDIESYRKVVYYFFIIIEICNIIYIYI